MGCPRPVCSLVVGPRLGWSGWSSSLESSVLRALQQPHTRRPAGSLILLEKLRSLVKANNALDSASTSTMLGGLGSARAQAQRKACVLAAPCRRCAVRCAVRCAAGHMQSLSCVTSVSSTQCAAIRHTPPLRGRISQLPFRTGRVLISVWHRASIAFIQVFTCEAAPLRCYVCIGVVAAAGGGWGASRLRSGAGCAGFIWLYIRYAWCGCGPRPGPL